MVKVVLSLPTGGTVTVAGSPEEVIAVAQSLSGDALSLNWPGESPESTYYPKVPNFLKSWAVTCAYYESLWRGTVGVLAPSAADACAAALRAIDNVDVVGHSTKLLPGNEDTFIIGVRELDNPLGTVENFREMKSVTIADSETVPSEYRDKTILGYSPRYPHELAISLVKDISTSAEVDVPSWQQRSSEIIALLAGQAGTEPD